jgi:hypothetical protein
MYSRSWTSESDTLLLDTDLATFATFDYYFYGILCDYLHVLWILLTYFLLLFEQCEDLC